MKKPFAYISAAWSGQEFTDTDQAVVYCRKVYQAGFTPICPVLCPLTCSLLCGGRGIAASCRAGIRKYPALWLATITTAPCCGKPTTARAQSAATFCCVRIFCCSADTSSRQNSYGKTILKLWMNCWPTRKMQKSKSNSLPASARFSTAKSVSRNVLHGKKKSKH